MFGLFGSKERERAEGIIKVIHNYYGAAKTRFPNKNEAFYLALAWAIYAKKHHSSQYAEDDLSSLLLPAFTDTLVFSFLKPPDSINALSLFMINKERLSIAKEYEPRFRDLMLKFNATQTQIEQAMEEALARLAEEANSLEGISEKDF